MVPSKYISDDAQLHSRRKNPCSSRHQHLPALVSHHQPGCGAAWRCGSSSATRASAIGDGGLRKRAAPQRRQHGRRSPQSSKFGWANSCRPRQQRQCILRQLHHLVSETNTTICQGARGRDRDSSRAPRAPLQAHLTRWFSVLRRVCIACRCAAAGMQSAAGMLAQADSCKARSGV